MAKAKKSDVLLVPGFDGYYASSNGKILSRHRGALLEMNVSPQKSGHMNIKLRRDGKTVTRWVHRLILESFVGRCPDGCECRHLDGDPSNNRLENLRWDSV